MMLDKGEGEKSGVEVRIGKEMSLHDRRLTMMNSSEDLLGPIPTENEKFAWEKTKYYSGIVWGRVKERVPESVNHIISNLVKERVIIAGITEISGPYTTVTVPLYCLGSVVHSLWEMRQLKEIFNANTPVEQMPQSVRKSSKSRRATG